MTLKVINYQDNKEAKLRCLTYFLSEVKRATKGCFYRVLLMCNQIIFTIEEYEITIT